MAIELQRVEEREEGKKENKRIGKRVMHVGERKEKKIIIIVSVIKILDMHRSLGRGDSGIIVHPVFRFQFSMAEIKC